MRERTLSIIKPDGVARHLIGNVVARLEDEELEIVAMKMIRMTKGQAKGFYRVHEGKPFFESVTDFMSSGPCVVMVLEGTDAIRKYRKLMGATNYKEAPSGTPLPRTLKKMWSTAPTRKRRPDLKLGTFLTLWRSRGAETSEKKRPRNSVYRSGAFHYVYARDTIWIRLPWPVHPPVFALS